jgi:alkylhydroperoxidase family enzyme
LLAESVPVEKLALVQAWREGGELFTERERVALAWAESTTRIAETGAPDAEFEAASAAFTQKELVDLTLAISLMNAYNRIAIGFRATPSAAKKA